MHLQTLITHILLTSALVAALPLNINLGAYSPALVVGDGAIEFEEGGDAVTNIINTLEGTAANTAAASVGGSAPAPAPAAPATPPPAALLPPSGGGASTKLTGAAVATEPESNPILLDKISALPPPGTSQPIYSRHKNNDDQDEVVREKRDLSGFDRALQFAETALSKGPDIQLGTGAEGSGVGVIVDNNAGGIGAGVPVGGSTAPPAAPAPVPVIAPTTPSGPAPVGAPAAAAANVKPFGNPGTGMIIG